MYQKRYIMARRGGNPDIKDHGFTTDRDEPLKGRLTLRLPESLVEKLEELGDEKAEFCRDAIKKALDERNSKNK